MSRNPVGDVYAKVIREVCEQSRIDFEEGGVELATLDLLQSEWQRKLSQLRVAQLPWDPTPTPNKDTTLPSSSKSVPAQTLASNGSLNNTPIQQGNTLPNIKSEAQQYPPVSAPPPPYTVPSFPTGQPTNAQQRAALNLHRTYGDRAGPQIAELQQSGQPRPPTTQQGVAPPGYIKQEDSKPSLSSLDDYRPEQSQQSSVPIKTDQTDGAAEWQDEYVSRKEAISQHRERNDRMLREYFLSSQQQLEGGGLMLPLDQRHMPNLNVRRQVMALASSLPTAEKASVHVPSVIRAQADATGDDEEEEEDENAINSDLDDPDELAGNEEDGENTDQVMLCTWDKVQRVKNKWKCTLKDGVLRVEGSEYVFHKGQGEFEW